MNKIGYFFFIFLGMMMSVPYSLAHHSFVTTYDLSRKINISGVVTDYRLKSPHSFINMDVMAEDGNIKNVEFEMHSVPVLRRTGFDAESFKPGDKITVIAWPHRKPEKSLYFGIAVITEDGTVMATEPGEYLVEALKGETASDQVTGIEKIQGRWLAPIPKHQPQSPLPLTPAGLDARENYDPDDSPANTCEPYNIPGVYYAPYLTDIIITDSEVMLYHESYNISRTIPLNAHKRLAESSGKFGMTSGKIEGDALLIESSDFPESAWGLALALDTNGAGTDIPSSSEKKLTERLTVSEDASSLIIEYTLEDPVYLSQPYSSVVQLNRVADDSPMYEFNCEIGSATRFTRDQ